MGKAMVPASVIADLVCTEIGDNTGAKKFQILQYIALGFQHMNLYLNIDHSIKTELFDVGTDTQFEMGCGFVYETKVGIRRKATNEKPAGPICVLRLNTDFRKSTKVLNDTETLIDMSEYLSNVSGNCDCRFYNSPFGILEGYGCGYANNHYYSVADGCINISPYLHKLGEDLELVVEHVNDVLTEGVILIPAEAFSCMHYYAQARLNQEGQYGKWQLMYESAFITLQRLYNFRPADYLTQIYY